MNEFAQDMPSDLAAVALNLVSETAAAIKESEEQAAHALSRETMLRLAEAQIKQMIAAAEQLRGDLDDGRRGIHGKSRSASPISGCAEYELFQLQVLPTLT